MMDWSDSYIENRATKESRKLHPNNLVARDKCRAIMIKRAKWVREKNEKSKDNYPKEEYRGRRQHNTNVSC